MAMPLTTFLSLVAVLLVALAPLPAAADDELLPELKAPILAPLKSTLLVLLIRVPRFAAMRLPLRRVDSSAADIIVINTNLYLV